MASIKKTKKNKPSKQQQKVVAPAKPEQKKTGSKISEHKKRNGISKPILPGSWKTNTGIFFLLVIATVVLYSGDLRLGFFSVDDPDYVVNNPWIRGVSSENISHILGNPYFANYSPVHLLSYMADYAFGGAGAYAFHFSSNLWAGLVAGFVYMVALALTNHRITAVAAAILFVVHPSHVEAIAWISSRKDLVAAAFALPSFLAYLAYRRGDKTAKRWYIISLLLFLLAVAGKLSVATFPVVFFAYDLFVEKRALSRSIIDKIPFLLAAVIIAVAAASAQPSMGNQPDPYVLAAALAQNFWLLTGFGSYVLYRVPPETSEIVLKIGGAFVLLAVFIVPWLIRRRFPMFVVLIYWILFAFIPTQVLSFTHPVTDRYLFFPSVAAVIIIARGIFMITKKINPSYNLAAGSVLILILTFLWGRKTLNYIAEWRDPKSVWFAASKKSSDPVVPQNLGTYYLDVARRFGKVSEEDKRFASSVWADDKRLPQLLSEWASGQHGGPMEKIFLEYTRNKAWDAFEQSLRNKGNRVMPGLYYNRGLLLLDLGNLKEAKKEFLDGVNEASRESFTAVRQQLTVYCHTDLGIIAWRTGNFREALDWFRQAEEEQIRFGGNWIPDLTSNRKKLEQIVASQPSK